ncbi:MAG: VOC family protein [Deltaproteobacteria bacterium]|nr:VOC family protein [Deltaproteobacteria bacterium]
MGKIIGINHVAFVVKDLEESIRNAVDVLGGEFILKFESTGGKYIGTCIQLGDSIVSYLQATDESSFIAKHLEKRGPGVQHMGLTIEGLDEYVADLEAKGIRVEKSDMGDEKFKEALVGPKTGQGVVLQLMEWRDGTMDTTPQGKEQLKRKYRETPGLKILDE